MIKLDRFLKPEEINESFNLLRAKAEDLFSRIDNQGITLHEFILNREAYLTRSIAAIRAGTYAPAPAHAVTITADKPRIVYKFDWIDRFWFDHLARFIRRYAEPALSDCVYSFRKGRNAHQAIRRVSTYMKENRGPIYIIRRDVQNYGPSMVHDEIVRIFDYVVPQSSAARLVMRAALTFPFIENGEIQHNSTGLPAGSALQTVFDNLYLSSLDRALESISCAQYTRFGDDLLFVTHDRVAAEEAAAHVAAEFTKLGLVSHPDKSMNLVLRQNEMQSNFKAVQHFEYLGLIIDHHGAYHLPHRKRNEIKKWLCTRLEELVVPLALESPEEVVSLAAELIRGAFSAEPELRANPLAYYAAMASDETELRALDLWIAQRVLKLALKRGFKRSNFKYFPYKKLRVLGLPSLLHVQRKGWVL